MKLTIQPHHTKLLLTPLALLLLVSNCTDSYGMQIGRSSKASGKKPAAGATADSTNPDAKASPTSTSITPAVDTGASKAVKSSLIDLAMAAAAPALAAHTGVPKPGDSSTTSTHEALIEAPKPGEAASAAPEVIVGRSYSEAVTGTGLTTNRGVATPAAVPSGALTPRATADSATPPVRPTSPKIKIGEHMTVPKAVELEIVTEAPAFGTRMSYWVGREVPHVVDSKYYLHLAENKLQHAAAAGDDANAAKAVEMLQEAQRHHVNLNAYVADGAYSKLHASNDVRCAELEAQMSLYRRELTDTVTAIREHHMHKINALAHQILLRKRGKIVAAEIAKSSGSKVVRSPSPVEDYTPADNTAATADFITALDTYIARTTGNFVPRVKAAARIAAAGSGGGAEGSASDRR